MLLSQHDIKPKRRESKQNRSEIALPSDLQDPPKEIPLRSLQDCYKTVSSLGSGSFGSVVLAKIKDEYVSKLALDLTNPVHKNTLRNVNLSVPCNKSYSGLHVVAIKTMTKRLSHLRDYTKVKEVRFILSVPSHPNLVQIYDLLIDSTTFQLQIVMESMDQNLYQLMRARKSSLFSPNTLRSILVQLLAGISHIHKHNFFHRDVKPENILVVSNTAYYGSKESIPPSRRKDAYIVKLADYGLARHVDNVKPYTAYVSTRWYRSPEILLRQKFYSCPVDMWAFATVAVEVTSFRPLFPGSNELDQLWKILEVLGSPEPSSNAYSAEFEPDSFASSAVPLGGYWPKAQSLAGDLGFSLPEVAGISMYQLIPRTDLPTNDLLDLLKVVKACLVWDPEKRASATDLQQMSYFRNHVPQYHFSDRTSNEFVSHAPLATINHHSIHNTEWSKTTNGENRFVNVQTAPLYNNNDENMEYSKPSYLQSKKRRQNEMVNPKNIENPVYDVDEQSIRKFKEDQYQIDHISQITDKDQMSEDDNEDLFVEFDPQDVRDFTDFSEFKKDLNPSSIEEGVNYQTQHGKYKSQLQDNIMTGISKDDWNTNEYLNYVGSSKYQSDSSLSMMKLLQNCVDFDMLQHDQNTSTLSDSEIQKLHPEGNDILTGSPINIKPMEEEQQEYTWNSERTNQFHSSTPLRPHAQVQGNANILVQDPSLSPKLTAI
ncbi:hypothetical protein LJB42_000707 [Komagataella kurtzmanii]|nr:hypothetical protein LJB42_000707 [Komagataella kurtzmanii]